jgi:tetratricopeptide (TPR) repeat protein
VRIFADGRQVVVRDGASAWEPDTGQMMLLFDVGELARAAGVVVPMSARRSRRSRARGASATALFERALRLEDKDRKGACDAYQLALELDPSLSDAWVNLGRLVHEDGRVAEATSHYRRALQVAPSDPVAHYNLALALEDQGDIPGAVRQYREALRSDAGFADAHFNLGRLLDRLGQRSQAVQHLVAYKQLTDA